MRNRKIRKSNGLFMSVNADGDVPEKRIFFQEHGIEYMVLTQTQTGFAGPSELCFERFLKKILNSKI